MICLAFALMFGDGSSAFLSLKLGEKKKAEKEIKRIDKQRENHYKYYTQKEWKDFKNYDLCINSDALGVEKTADMICEIANKKAKTYNKI